MRSTASSDGRLTAMLERLSKSGLKLTAQRVSIVRELANDASHPTAQELFERLRPSKPTMSFATVYNTLHALAAEGLCEARSLAPGAARFDPNVTPHHHAVCDRCGRVSDVPEPPASSGAARPSARAPEGFAVRAVEQIFRGLCAACQGSPTGEPRARPTMLSRPCSPGRVGRRAGVRP